MAHRRWCGTRHGTRLGGHTRRRHAYPRDQPAEGTPDLHRAPASLSLVRHVARPSRVMPATVHLFTERYKRNSRPGGHAEVATPISVKHPRSPAAWTPHTAAG